MGVEISDKDSNEPDKSGGVKIKKSKLRKSNEALIFNSGDMEYGKSLTSYIWNNKYLRILRNNDHTY